MNAYVYQAALLCDKCGSKVRKELARRGDAPANPKDEHTYDSDDFPKGPYSNGGGEADTPQHCDSCGVFLENDLTSEGYRYVEGAIRDDLRAGKRNSVAVKTWAPFYDIDVQKREAGERVSLHRHLTEAEPVLTEAIYLGHKEGGDIEIFTSPSEPTRASHGNKYLAVVGPFRTRDAAIYMQKTHPNPHAQTVGDAERMVASLKKKDQWPLESVNEAESEPKGRTTCILCGVPTRDARVVCPACEADYRREKESTEPVSPQRHLTEKLRSMSGFKPCECHDPDHGHPTKWPGCGEKAIWTEENGKRICDECALKSGKWNESVNESQFYLHVYPENAYSPDKGWHFPKPPTGKWVLTHSSLADHPWHGGGQMLMVGSKDEVLQAAKNTVDKNTKLKVWDKVEHVERIVNGLLEMTLDAPSCPSCGSTRIMSHGDRGTDEQHFTCRDCDHEFSEKKPLLPS